MDMGSSSMTEMATATVSSITSATSTTAAMSMGGGSKCKISMLWNWYTIDSCFIARTWHIRSTGMFAGSCIGVVLLVMSLEFLRRASKEYDVKIRKQSMANTVGLQDQTLRNSASSRDPEADPGASASSSHSKVASSPLPSRIPRGKFRPNLLQQMIRATFHMIQFAVAYFVMLLAMYYNGYIIISIFIGAWLGSFVFSWEDISMIEEKAEVTCCCG